MRGTVVWKNGSSLQQGIITFNVMIFWFEPFYHHIVQQHGAVVVQCGDRTVPIVSISAVVIETIGTRYGTTAPMYVQLGFFYHPTAPMYVQLGFFYHPSWTSVLLLYHV